MKKRISILLFLAMVFLFTSCTQKLTHDEFTEIQNEFNDYFDIVFEKISERSNYYVKSKKTKRNDVEVDTLLRKMKELLTESKSKISDEDNEAYIFMADVFEKLHEAENIIQNDIGKESELVSLYDQLQEYNETETVNLDLNNEIVESLEKISGIAENDITDFMNEKSISYTGDDVQYDIANFIDKEFVLAGKLELDDYYNYGYDDDIEDSYFCCKLEQDNGGDRWYLYFHRESYNDLFNVLKKGEVTAILACEITSYCYEKNQGNMAGVNSLTYLKNK